jgi:hypothetical protein
MYGSIFNLKPKKEKKQALIDTLGDNSSVPDGGVAWLVMNPDSNEDLIAIAIFKDKESYKLNAEKPETHSNFIKMMSYLEEEPTWNDGSFIISEFN